MNNLEIILSQKPERVKTYQDLHNVYWIEWGGIKVETDTAEISQLEKLLEEAGYNIILSLCKRGMYRAVRPTDVVEPKPWFSVQSATGETAHVLNDGKNTIVWE